MYFRDLFKPPKIVLREAGIKHGFTILDYGCGSGNYSIPASELLEGTGVVFALDNHPLAIKSISKKIKKKSITNIETIHSNYKTGLASNSVDVVLLYHIFNDLKNPYEVLKEIHRVLKPDGVVSLFEFNQNIISRKLERIGFFQLEKKIGKTHTFVKNSISSKISIPKKLNNSHYQNRKMAEGLITKNNLILVGILAIVGYSVVVPMSVTNFLADADMDGQIDSFDNCPNYPNPDQLDFDFDKTGDVCDLDDDNDGVVDKIDLFDLDSSEWSDFDSDRIGDNADIDDDNDGILDVDDHSLLLSSENLGN